jgi:hypothetical protein
VAPPAGEIATTSGGASVATTADDVPWLGIGLGVAGGVALVAGTAVAVWLLSSEETTVGVTIRRAG